MRGKGTEGGHARSEGIDLLLRIALEVVKDSGESEPQKCEIDGHEGRDAYDAPEEFIYCFAHDMLQGTLSNHKLRDVSDSESEGGMMTTHASNNVHEHCGVRLWEGARRIHLVHEEGNVAGAELLNEKMTEKVIIAREVADVHHLVGEAPFEDTRRAGTSGARCTRARMALLLLRRHIGAERQVSRCRDRQGWREENNGIPSGLWRANPPWGNAGEENEQVTLGHDLNVTGVTGLPTSSFNRI